MKRILNDPDDIRDTDPLFQSLRKAVDDPVLFEDLQWVSFVQSGFRSRLTGFKHDLCIGHDMTQYFANVEG